MSIYRGAGGSGDAVNDSSSEATLVAQLAVQAQSSADAAATSASAAAGSASSASTSAAAAAASAASINLSSIAITGGSINNTSIGASTASTGAFSTVAYTGTLTGGTGVVNLGSGQFYKAAGGNIGLGTTSPTYGTLEVAQGNAGSVSVINNTVGAWAFRKVRSDGSTGMGIYDATGFGVPAIYVNGAEGMRITSSGGVSFGSSGTNYGTSGQVLTSAGNAPPTWTTPTTGTVTSVTGTSPISSSGGATPAISLDNSGVTANTYGSSSSIPVITVNAKGLLTSVTTATPTVSATNITTGTLPSAQLPAGSVLQVVNATYSTIVSNSTSTYADTNLTATITPKFATSKILVLVNQNGCRKQTNDTYIQLRLVRGSTAISTFAGGAAYTGTTTPNDIGSISTCYLDSPGTTSATTYKTQLASGSNNAQVNVQTVSDTSTITLMVIAA